MATGLVVDDLRVLFVGVPVFRPRAVLQFCNRIRGPHVLFAPGTPRVLAAGIQHVRQYRGVAKGKRVHFEGLFSHLENADAFDATGCAAEVFADEVTVQANGFKQLGATIAHVR